MGKSSLRATISAGDEGNERENDAQRFESGTGGVKRRVAAQSAIGIGHGIGAAGLEYAEGEGGKSPGARPLGRAHKLGETGGAQGGNPRCEGASDQRRERQEWRCRRDCREQNSKPLQREYQHERAAQADPVANNAAQSWSDGRTQAKNQPLQRPGRGAAIEGTGDVIDPK